MGAQHSKISSGGKLQGAYVPSTADIPEANLPKMSETKKYRAVVPESVTRPSDGTNIMTAPVNGDDVTLKIPRGLKGGDQFHFSHNTKPEYEKVFTSTLPILPGMEIIQSKQIIWGSVSFSFRARGLNQAAQGKQVAKLLQEAQTKIIEQVLQLQCNACLGMTFNITNDSSGEYGEQKLVIVTACGTPCVVVPCAKAPIIASATVVEASAPLYG